MSCLYQRPRNPKTGVFWIGFYHPKTGALVRVSLETTDPKVAKRLRKAVDARCGAAGPIDEDMPTSIVEFLRDLEPKPASMLAPETAHKEGEKSVSQPVRGCGTPQPMAAIYPRPADAPDPMYWVAVYHPRTGALIRRSLEKRNREEALRKARKIEALCGVLSTLDIEVPDSILEDIGWNSFVKNLSSTNPAQPAVLVVKRCTAEEALRSLLSNMLVGNDDHYLDGTLSIARRLFGSNLVDRVDPRPTPPSPKDKRKAKHWEPGIDAKFLSDITSEKMTAFFAKQAFSSDTCRHYKEFVRKLINHAIKSGIHVPENPFAPNPIDVTSLSIVRNCGCGIDLFVTQKISWNQFNKFPHHTFWWDGIDGTRIFSHFPPADTYNGNMDPKELIYSVANFKEHGHATRSLYLYGYGDGVGGPTISMLKEARRQADLDGLPKLQSEKVADSPGKPRKRPGICRSGWASFICNSIAEPIRPRPGPSCTVGGQDS